MSCHSQWPVSENWSVGWGTSHVARQTYQEAFLTSGQVGGGGYWEIFDINLSFHRLSKLTTDFYFHSPPFSRFLPGLFPSTSLLQTMSTRSVQQSFKQDREYFRSLRSSPECPPDYYDRKSSRSFSCEDWGDFHGKSRHHDISFTATAEYIFQGQHHSRERSLKSKSSSTKIPSIFFGVFNQSSITNWCPPTACHNFRLKKNHRNLWKDTNQCPLVAKILLILSPPTKYASSSSVGRMKKRQRANHDTFLFTTKPWTNEKSVHC